MCVFVFKTTILMIYWYTNFNLEYRFTRDQSNICFRPNDKQVNKAAHWTSYGQLKTGDARVSDGEQEVKQADF